MTPGEEKLWSETIRRAFVIPDVISEANVERIIARRMLKELSVPDLASATIDLATRHVAALRAAAISGALDLPVCGFGEMTPPRPNVSEKETEEPLVATAVGAIKGRLTDGGGARDVWIEWLFQKLSGHVTTHPHADDWTRRRS